MSSASGIAVCFISALTISSTSAGWWLSDSLKWYDQKPESCPSVNNETHVCSTLVSGNFTCITIACCDYFKDNFYDDSEYVDYNGEYDNVPDDDDEYQVYYAGRIDQCSVCYTMRNCTLFRCFDRCCDGYTRDFYGRCANNSGEIQCENGGTYIKYGGFCLCPEGFSGVSCEIPDCRCENGGRCTVLNGRPYCNCTEGYSGDRCQTVSCTLQCQNGGTCVTRYGTEHCTCPPYYVGDLCEQKFEQPGSCPNPEHVYSYYCSQECSRQSDCSESQVCCQEGCSKVCREPVDTCSLYGRTFHVGDTHKPDPCTTCRCEAGGDMPCMVVDCAYPMCSTGAPITRPGECCPTCPDDLRQSVITCPRNTLELNITSPYTSGVWLKMEPTNVTATDRHGRRLTVDYTPRYIEHCKCYHEKYSVKAYARDESGRQISCNFDVVLRDRVAPRFTSCPDNIYILEGETPNWQEPMFQDNVGIAKKRCPEKKKVYPVGSHMMRYVISDYDMNKAECYFIINVTSKDTPFEEMPRGLRQRSTGTPSRIGIIVGPIVGGIALLAVILLLLLCFQRHQDRQARSLQSQAYTPTRLPRNLRQGFDNNIYALPGDVKLPPYSAVAPPDSCPPKYSSMRSMKGVEYIYQPPPNYTNPGYEQAPSVHNKTNGDDTMSVKSGGTDHTYATLK